MSRFLLIALLLLPAYAQASTWPNEPAGSTVITDCAFNPGSICPEWFNVYNTYATANFANAPASPSSVMDNYLAVGAIEGSGQWGVILDYPTELFVGAWWSTNSDFVGMCNNTNKMLFVRNNDGFYGDNNFLQWNGPPGVNNKTILWSMQAEYDNCHKVGWNGGCWINPPETRDGTGGFLPNVGSGQVATGSGWHRIEFYLKSSTTNVSKNGIIRWWVDGGLVGDYPGVNLTPGGFREFQINSTWDGSSCLQARDKTKRWDHYYDHIKISAPNCGASCGGGPTPDTIPPSQVTGVTASNITGTTTQLNWTAATDNVAVTGYQVERCAGAGCTNYANQQTASIPSLGLTGLTPGTPYQVRIKAFDSAGNVSTSYSATATWTTTATVSLPAISLLDADATGAAVAWTGSPGSIRVQTDTLNVIEPMTAFPATTSSITKVQSRSVAGSGSSISLAYTSNNAAGNLLALRYAGGPGSVTLTSCSDTQGNTWTAIPNATGGTGGHQAMRYAANSRAGANAVTCTLSGAATFSVLDLFEYSGVHTTAPLSQSKLTAQTNPGTGSNAVSSGSVTTAYDGELVLGATLQVGEQVFSAYDQFSSTQGSNGWYYYGSDGVAFTWNGSYWSGASYPSGIWTDGSIPSSSLNTVRRWVAPSDGNIRITGYATFAEACGGDGTTVYIKKNGTTLYSAALSPIEGDTKSFDVSSTAVATDQFEFITDKNSNASCDNTIFRPIITLGTASGSGGTTTSVGTGFTLQHATYSDSPIESKIQTTAGSVAATFTGGNATNDYITSIATFRPATVGNARYSRVWPVGTTFVCMYARNASGNENTVSPGYLCDSITIATTDTTVPVRSNPLPGGTLAAGTTSATISIATDEVSTCKYGTSAGVAYSSIASTFTVSSSGLFHSATVSSLSDGTTYTFYVRCQDAFGNPNTTDTTLSFSVAAVATDTTPPSQVTGLSCQALNASQIACTWSAATDNVAVTGYELYADRELSGSVLVGTSATTNLTLSGLAASSFYVLKVRAQDAVGNLGTFSSALSVLTPFADVSAPSDLSGLTVTPVDFQALDITWTAGTDNVGVTGTTIEMCEGSACTLFALRSTVRTGTTLRVSGLNPITTYRFRGKHADAAGNVSLNYSSTVSGVTAAVPSATVTAMCRCKHRR